MNQSLFQYIHHFVGRSIFGDAVAVFFASDLLYLLIAGFFVLLFFEKGNRRRLYVFCEAALATLLSRGIVTETIHFLYNHPRPYLFYGFTPLISESGPSFPSAHMTFLFALATVIWYTNRKWGIVYFILSFIVGIARIYTGVHWPFDILGGILIGIICAIIVHLLFKNSREQLYTVAATNPDAV